MRRNCFVTYDLAQVRVERAGEVLLCEYEEGRSQQDEAGCLDNDARRRGGRGRAARGHLEEAGKSWMCCLRMSAFCWPPCRSVRPYEKLAQLRLSSSGHADGNALHESACNLLSESF